MPGGKEKKKTCTRRTRAEVKSVSAALLPAEQYAPGRISAAADEWKTNNKKTSVSLRTGKTRTFCPLSISGRAVLVATSIDGCGKLRDCASWFPPPAFCGRSLFSFFRRARRILSFPAGNERMRGSISAACCEERQAASSSRGMLRKNGLTSRINCVNNINTLDTEAME